MKFLWNLLVTAICLGIVAFFTVGFYTEGFGALLLASLVIAGLNALLDTVVFRDEKRKNSGFTGFVVSIIVLLITSKIVDGFNITLIGAIIASIFIGAVGGFGLIKKEH